MSLEIVKALEIIEEVARSRTDDMRAFMYDPQHGPGKHPLVLDKPSGVTLIKDVGDGYSQAEVHDGEDDVWVGWYGTMRFHEGGVLVNSKAKVGEDGSEVPGEWLGDMRGGETALLLPEGTIFIPRGTPHRHRAVSRRRTDNTPVAGALVVKLPLRRR
jgi:hypothetical protein